MNKERVVWLDYARFFSVFLVILFHTPPTTRVFDGRIACILFYTVFFTISGYLFDISRYSNFRQFFTHRGKQILVPYVTFFMVVY
ncbi:MAG: acyltransferase family protein, partial [Muribaculaceae bacterium]|nr:acyltransferase family protein [Muribaculaceae bacterium]